MDRAILFIRESKRPLPTPVSYTHLDVYKRQAHYGNRIGEQQLSDGFSLDGRNFLGNQLEACVFLSLIHIYTTPSGEDYLEAILILQRQKGLVRPVDIARHMEFSKPSITHAITTLQRGDVYKRQGGNCSPCRTGSGVPFTEKRFA